MALQVWLPLTGHLENQGLSDITVTNNGATVDNSGKLGKCYLTNGSNQYISGTYNGTTNISFSAWVYMVTVKSGHIFDARNSDTSGYQPIYVTSNSLQIGGSGTNFATFSYTWSANTWYHICVVHNATDGKLYVNGELIGTSTSAKGYNYGVKNFTLGCRCNQTSYTNVKLNDVRIYDHALSPKEVKLLSQGLVCHYKLDDIYATNNLIVNGYGQDDGTGWTAPSYYSTTEIPPDHPEIKASFHSSTESPLIPWDGSHTYTISAYLKAKDSGTSYPAFRPYDIDKKYIQYFHCSMAFSSAYKTTLAQPLHKGDTIIYATDLSAWTTGDNYYYHVAIFGYKDSTGYVYPDLQYTQDSPTFGTKTDKSHIDKTNNTITLNSAYTGEDRPAGTTICQATEGSTYFYPFGGINTSTIQDWTYKTATITPQLDGRLRFAKYIRYIAYYYAYHAGIQLVDNTAGTDIVYDSSGYNYHGQINTDMSISSNTSRNQLATSFDGVGNCITIPFNGMLGVTEATKKDYTVSVWTYKEVIGSKSYQTILGGPSGFELEARSSTSTNPLYRLHNWGGGTTAYEFNKWNHFCFVHTSDDAKLYVNGELKITGTSANIPVGNFFIGAWKTATQQNFDGRMSDFRIYATALSPEDIQQLYNAPVSISNSGAMFTQGGFVES